MITGLISIILGILSWPFLEYFLHRFLGHVWNLNTAFRREHQQHHQFRDFFVPALHKLIMAVFVLGIIFFTGIFLDLTFQVYLFCIGILTAYLFYEWTHYSFHKKAPRTQLGLKLRKHHFFHHFKNAKKNFGVTNSWIDHWFGTYIEPEKIKVPQSFAMVWLTDSQGNVKPEYQNHFEIKTF
jgi:dihydroceramide fatty acyl 2-hydroxylase